MAKITKILSILLTLVLVFGNSVFAAKLNSVSDTLSDSEPGVKANHTLKFTTKSSITASSTIVIDFADGFQSTSTPAFDAADVLDYDIATSTGVAEFTINVAGKCPNPTLDQDTAEFEITSISSANVFTFTHCNGTLDVAANSDITVEIGTNAAAGGTGDSQLANPTAAGSYVITITAPAADSADTRVAIVPDVTVTAKVKTNFTLAVTVTSGTIATRVSAESAAGAVIVIT